MIRLHQGTHFDFKITAQPGDYLNPTLEVNLRPDIQKWLDDYNVEWRYSRTDEDNSTYLLIIVDLDIADPDHEMLFKLTWL